jgi:hypothetical protein
MLRKQPSPLAEGCSPSNPARVLRSNPAIKLTHFLALGFENGPCLCVNIEVFSQVSRQTASESLKAGLGSSWDEFDFCNRTMDCRSLFSRYQLSHSALRSRCSLFGPLNNRQANVLNAIIHTAKTRSSRVRSSVTYHPLNTSACSAPLIQFGLTRCNGHCCLITSAAIQFDDSNPPTRMDATANQARIMAQTVVKRA